MFLDEIALVRTFAIVQERLEHGTDDDTEVHLVLYHHHAGLVAVSLLSHHDCLKRDSVMR